MFITVLSKKEALLCSLVGLISVGIMGVVWDKWYERESKKLEDSYKESVERMHKVNIYDEIFD